MILLFCAVPGRRNSHYSEEELLLKMNEEKTHIYDSSGIISKEIILFGI